MHGEIPGASLFTAFENLRSLFLEGTLLSGSLPADYSLLESLEDAILGSALIGNLPTGWSRLSRLAFLDLSGNSAISGTLPPQYSTLGHLQSL